MKYIMLKNAYSITGLLTDDPERTFYQGQIEQVTEDDFNTLIATKLFKEPNKEDIEKQKERLKNFLHTKGNSKDIQAERTKSKHIDLGKLKNQKILFVRQGGIGDVLNLFPIAAYVRSLENTCRVGIATDQRLLSLIAASNQVDLGLTYEKQMDISQYGQVLSFRGAVEANPKAETMHMVDAGYDWIGINPQDVPAEFKRPLIKPSQAAQENADRIWSQWNLNDKIVIGLTLRASSRLRSWNPVYNKQLGEALAKRGVKVMLLDRATDLEFGGENILSYCGKLTIDQLVGVISKLTLLVSPDTGNTHIAGALGVPIVAIFAAFKPEFRLAYYENAVSTQGKRECAPCFHHKTSQCKHSELGKIPPCMEEISVKEVYQLVRSQISKITGIDISLKK